MGSIKGKEITIEMALIDDVNKAYDSAISLLKDAKTKATLANNGLKIAQNIAQDGLDKSKALGVDTKMFTGRLQQIKEAMAIVNKML